MKTLKEIRNDLREIKYYYSAKAVFEQSSEEVFPEGVLSKVQRYANIVKNAPARLYVLYVSLYVNNNTQRILAEDWGFTPEYVRDMNKKLCLFIQANI